jgi:hypothetical protein
VIFIPPSHFSIETVQRGTIIMFVPVGIAEGVVIAPVPAAIPMPIMFARSIIMAVLMAASPQVRAVDPSVRPGNPAGPAMPLIINFHVRIARLFF